MSNRSSSTSTDYSDHSDDHSINTNAFPENWLCTPSEYKDLIYAVLSGNVDRVRHLSALGYYISAANSWVVYQACLQGLDMLRALALNSRSGLNGVMPWQTGDRLMHLVLRTPSHRFSSNKGDIIEFLIREGANPLDHDRQGYNALHILAQVPTQSDTDGYGMIKMLLSRDAHPSLPSRVRDECLSAINARTTNGLWKGVSALMIAVMNNHADCVQVLLEHGADVHTTGHSSQPPLFFAVSRNYKQVAEILLHYGAFLSASIKSQARSIEMAEMLEDFYTY